MIVTQVPTHKRFAGELTKGAENSRMIVGVALIKEGLPQAGGGQAGKKL